MPYFLRYKYHRTGQSFSRTSRMDNDWQKYTSWPYHEVISKSVIDLSLTTLDINVLKKTSLSWLHLRQKHSPSFPAHKSSLMANKHPDNKKDQLTTCTWTAPLLIMSAGMRNSLWTILGVKSRLYSDNILNSGQPTTVSYQKLLDVLLVMSY